MGIETAVITMAAIAAVSEVGKAGAETAAASEKRKALDLQGKEIALQTQQKTLQNYAVMEKTLDAQAAHMTTTGLAFSSPSYNAIQRNTLNIGARKARNVELEGDLEEQNIDIEKKNVKNTLFAQLFGDTAETALAVGSLGSKLPTMET